MNICPQKEVFSDRRCCERKRQALSVSAYECSRGRICGGGGVGVDEGGV